MDYTQTIADSTKAATVRIFSPVRAETIDQVIVTLMHHCKLNVEKGLG